jgi:peptide/nickel transport system ATP-binding protein
MNKMVLKADRIFYRVNVQHHLNNASEEKIILKDISFEVQKGELLGIAGESGSGKTTLAKILSGVIQPSEGKIVKNFSKNGGMKKPSPIQILFQNNGEILNPLRTVDEMISEALRIRFGKKTEIKTEKEKIYNLINFSVDLWNRKGYELSGGEQQRAALGRILSVNPELLILDEPFSSQDPESQHNLLNLFKKINEEFGITLICIAHNLKILRKIAQKILIIYKGEIVESGSAAKILKDPEHPYTKFLLKAEDYDLSYDEFKLMSEKI